MKLFLRVALFSTLLLILVAAQLTAIEDQPWRQYATPEQAGWSAAKLQEAYAYADRVGAAAVMIVHKGHVVAAWGEIEHNYKCHSMRKSFLSAMYGPYVANGTINLDSTMADLGIDDISPLTKQEKGARIRDLLAARSGVYHPAAYETLPMRERRPARGSHVPGTFWYYNNWDFNTLGHIFNSLTGKDLYDVFATKIAGTLGMEDFDVKNCAYHFERDRSRYPAYTFRLSARDSARFGQLLLQNGRWSETQIIPAAWVKESTTPISTVNDLGVGYAYMWWTLTANPKSDSPYADLERQSAFFAAGTGGQQIVVIPDLELVIVHRVDTDNSKNVSGGKILGFLNRIIAAKVGKAAVEPKLKDLEAIPFTGH